MRALELYCGIGGCAAALGERAGAVRAIDQSPVAIGTYRLNFPAHDARVANLEDVPAEELRSAEADLWWLSPPCQPYTVRGSRKDLDDPRATSFKRMLGMLPELLPPRLALENVEGFAGSRAHEWLAETLGRLGYRWQEHFVCPTDLGIPNRRPRFYLVASRAGELLPLPRADRARRRPLAEYLDADPAPELTLDPALAEKFGPGLRILDPADPDAYATCFTAAYGRSWMYSGSYLRTPEGGVRRFSPEEIARLLHFPASFRFAPGLSLRKRWHLVGNSLSVASVRHVLGALVPGLGAG